MEHENLEQILREINLQATQLFLISLHLLTWYQYLTARTDKEHEPRIPNLISVLPQN